MQHAIAQFSVEPTLLNYNGRWIAERQSSAGNKFIFEPFDVGVIHRSLQQTSIQR
jgi:hypothetical protein